MSSDETGATTHVVVSLRTRSLRQRAMQRMGARCPIDVEDFKVRAACVYLPVHGELLAKV